MHGIIFLSLFLNLQCLAPTSQAIHPVVYRHPLFYWDHLAYNFELYQRINPQDEPLSALYLFSGPDISNILMTTGATDLTFIDRLDVDLEGVLYWLDRWDQVDQEQTDDDGVFQQGFSERKIDGFWYKTTINRVGLERLIVLELKLLGISNDEINVDIEKGEISFLFQHPLSRQQRKRTLRFVQADIKSNPKFIASTLKNHSIDLLYFKAWPFDISSLESLYLDFKKHRVLKPDASLVISPFKQRFINFVSFINARTEIIRRIIVSDPQLAYIDMPDDELFDRLFDYSSSPYGWHMLIFKPQQIIERIKNNYLYSISA